MRGSAGETGPQALFAWRMLALMEDDHLGPTRSSDDEHADSAVTAQDVRTTALSLPRAYEAWVRDRVKFRVGRLVFLSLSPDETLLGFGCPKWEREGLVAAEPDKFLMPVPADLRYSWMRVRLAALDLDELEELIVESWRMSVPKGVWKTYQDMKTVG